MKKRVIEKNFLVLFFLTFDLAMLKNEKKTILIIKIETDLIINQNTKVFKLC